MGWADRVTAAEVIQEENPEKFASFCQQETGIPYPTVKQMIDMKKQINDFFAMYPQANYGSLCGMVRWAKERRKRYATPGNLIRGGFRYAWRDGYLPELDPNYDDVDENLEEKIEAALNRERDAEWRRRLIVAQTNDARREVYGEWVKARGGIDI